MSVNRGEPTLPHLVVRYVNDRRAKGEITKNTAAQYVSRLLDFADTAGVPPSMVKRRHVDRWLQRPGLSAHYRRARLTALRGFCEWLVLHRHLERDPTLGMKMPKLPPLLPRALAFDESAAVMEAARHDPRARLCCALIWQLGLRRSEVAAIQLGDIDRSKRTVGVRGKGGGGGVTRRLPITDEAWSALVAYLPSVPGSSGPLLRSKRNPDRGVSGDCVYEDVTKAMRQAGVKHYPWDGRTPHAGRHSCAQDLVDSGVDIRVVQKVLGHASIKNTEGYTRGAVRELREPMEGRLYGASAPA